MLRRKILLFLLICSQEIVFSQDIEKAFTSDFLTVSGGVSARTMYRSTKFLPNPFTYIFTGNVNLNIAGTYDIPFSFAYTNSKFQSSNLFSFNRFSMHPRYKWITAHIGDFDMNFSPYTINRYRVRGLGFDVSPLEDKLHVNVFYGNFFKAKEYDESNLNSVVSYKRDGFGINASYNFTNFELGAVFLKIQDDLNSLKKRIPVEKDIQPKNNVVIELNGGYNFNDKAKLHAEFSYSFITEDSRIEGVTSENALKHIILGNNITNELFKAYNFDFEYRLWDGGIGIRYEYIDPNYRTLAGYYFNNDLENIAINTSQSFLKKKLQLLFNIGLQRNNLDNSKANKLQRVVMSINTSYNGSKFFNIAAGYSSFQSFSKVGNQFDIINQTNSIEDELNNLEYYQLSQNGNININFLTRSNDQKRENIAINLNFQDVKNTFENSKEKNDNSIFYNGNISYNINFVKNAFSINSSFNSSLSKSLGINNLILGPSVTLSKSFYKNKLRLMSSISYNQSLNNGKKNNSFANIRFRTNYRFKKKHNFNFTILGQKKDSKSNQKSNFTFNLGYNYNFGKLILLKNKGKK